MISKKFYEVAVTNVSGETGCYSFASWDAAYHFTRMASTKHPEWKVDMLDFAIALYTRPDEALESAELLLDFAVTL